MHRGTGRPRAPAGLSLRVFSLALLSLMLLPLCALSDDTTDGLEIVIEGVPAEMADNIRAHVTSSWSTVTRLSSRRSRARYRERATQQAMIALRPFGYYQASVDAVFEPLNGGWRLLLRVDPGPPIRVSTTDVRLTGSGANDPVLQAWLAEWPLVPQSPLDQRLWEAGKQEGLDEAVAWGYLDARFSESRIALDLERGIADLVLVLDTGPRARMGQVRFEQDFLDGTVLRPVPRFREGDAYRADLVDALRTDLWKLGYFSSIDVIEERAESTDPPTVNFRVRLSQLHRVTHQGTIGYGTDTEFRTQYRHHRHQLSSRGDVLIAGFSWQTRDEEFQLYGEYRLPRRTEKLRYWQLNPIYRERAERLELEVEGREEKLPVADYRLEDLYLRLGHLTFRSRGSSVDWLQETLFVDFLSETNRIDRLFPTLGLDEELDPADLEPISTDTLAFGIEWNWPRFEGRGFDLQGHRERAWLFTANESLGSDVDFTQAYLSSRWNLRLTDRWRLLLRGEVGYTDARVEELVVEDEGETFVASVTSLPSRYRFRAGGSHSVRGYDFEELSNNGVGSNHVLTASAEFEFRLKGNWTAAAFVDTGNAFNDWSAVNLSTGAGVGVRWYTAGFPLRLDVAQAQDLEGKPWRLHFTIGSPLF